MQPHHAEQNEISEGEMEVSVERGELHLFARWLLVVRV